MKRRPYRASLLAVLAAALVRLALEAGPIKPSEIPFATFYLAVAVSAWAGGRGPGLFATFTGLLICCLLFLAPRGTLALDSGAFVQAALYLVVSGSILWLIETMHSAQQEATRFKEGLQARNLDLSTQRDRFRVTLASIGDAVITTDARARIEFMNAEAERLTGFTLEEARNQPFDRIVQTRLPGQDEPAGDFLTPILAGTQVRELASERLLLAPDGTTTPVADTTAPILAPDGKVAGAVVVLRDVSVYRTYENSLREADRRKDEFLAILAHELRNPLAPLQNALALVGTGEAKRTEWARAVMQRQLRHLVRLVDDLLDVARVTRGQLDLRAETVEVSSVVDDALEVASPALAAGSHRVIQTNEAGSVLIHVDRTRIAQVLTALLNNAAVYTPRGGRIEIATAAMASEVAITVSDTGVGIEAAALPGIFDMFLRADVHESNRGGLGVGLALSRRLVEMHGGRIEAHSGGPGRGSRFVVRLPRPPEAPVAAVPVVAVDTAPVPLRIVVIDDNADAADSLAALIDALGNPVRVAYDAVSGIALIREFEAQLAIIDIGMPGVDGHEAARRLKADPVTASVPLVALTGWGHGQDVDDALAAGFDRHVTKPIQLDALQSLIDTPQASPA